MREHLNINPNWTLHTFDFWDAGIMCDVWPPAISHQHGHVEEGGGLRTAWWLTEQLLVIWISAQFIHNRTLKHVIEGPFVCNVYELLNPESFSTTPLIQLPLRISEIHWLLLAGRWRFPSSSTDWTKYGKWCQYPQLYPQNCCGSVTAADPSLWQQSITSSTCV